MLQQLCQAVIDLNELKFVHGELSPGVVFLDALGNARLKIRSRLDSADSGRRGDIDSAYKF